MDTGNTSSVGSGGVVSSENGAEGGSGGGGGGGGQAELLPWACPFQKCGQRFGTFGTLTLHQMTHLKEEKQNFPSLRQKQLLKQQASAADDLEAKKSALYAFTQGLTHYQSGAASQSVRRPTRTTSRSAHEQRPRDRAKSNSSRRAPIPPGANETRQCRAFEGGDRRAGQGAGTVLHELKLDPADSQPHGRAREVR